MKEKTKKDFINILQKVSCEHSPQCNPQAFKFSWNIASSKGKTEIFFSCGVSKPMWFFSSMFSYKVSTWEKENRSKPLQKLVPTPADIVCTNTIPCSCYSHFLPKGSEISPQALPALLWGAAWDTGTRQMLQVWLLYNLLVKLYRTVWYLQPWPRSLSKGSLS